MNKIVFVLSLFSSEGEEGYKGRRVGVGEIGNSKGNGKLHPPG